MSSFLGSALGDAVGSVGSFMNAPRLDAIPESDSRMSSAQFASTSFAVEGDADIHACQRAIRELKDEIGQIRTEQSQAMDTLGQLTVSIAESLKSAMQRFEKRLMSEMDLRCDALERKCSEQAKKWQSPTAASERAPSMEVSGARSASLGKSPHGAGIKDSLNGVPDSLTQSNRSVSTSVSEKKQQQQQPQNFANKFGKIAASIEQSFQSLKNGQQAVDDTASDQGSTGTGPSRISFGGLAAIHRDGSDLDIASNASSATNQSGTLHHQAHLAKGGARAQSEDIRAFRPEDRQLQHSKPEALTNLGGRSRQVTRDRPHEASQPPAVNRRISPSPAGAQAYEGVESGKSADPLASLRRQPDRTFGVPRSGARSPSAISPDPVQFKSNSCAATGAPSHLSAMMGAARGASMGLNSQRPGQQSGAVPPGVTMGQQQRASSVQGVMMGSVPKYPYAARR